MKDRKWLGSALLLLTAMIWGTAFVAQRAGVEKIGPASLNASRMALAALFLGLVLLIRKKAGKRHGKPEARTGRQDVKGGIVCGCFLASASMCQQTGLVTTPAGKAGFITAMYIILVPIIAFLLLRRRISARVGLAVAVGAAGMYLLCVGEGFTLTPGDAWVCACAVLFSGHILCCDRFAAKGDPLVISAVQFLTASVICSALALITERTTTWEMLTAAAVPILYCGIMSGGVGYTLQMIAQKFTPPAVAALLMSLESVFAALAGALILGERMTGKELAGCAVIFAAILIVQIPFGNGRRGKHASVGQSAGK